MSFYGNIVNYFSAAFKKFRYLNARVKNKEGVVEIKDEDVEALLSQDVLTFDSTSPNFIEFWPAEDDENNKTVDMQLNVESLRTDLTVTATPSYNEGDSGELISFYNIVQDGPNRDEYEPKIKYSARYNSDNGNLYIPFIHVKGLEEASE